MTLTGEHQHPVPTLPTLDEYPARYECIPRLGMWRRQPVDCMRPLYWWLRQLHIQEWGVRGFGYEPVSATAVLALETPAHLMTALRCRPHERPAVQDLPSLAINALWRLGHAGWHSEIDQFAALLREQGLVQPARRARERRDVIPGEITVPEATVVAYWRCRELIGHRWTLEAFSRTGFVAQVPHGRDAVLAVFPSTMVDDGTAAAALANLMSVLSEAQLRELGRLVGAATVGNGPSQRQGGCR